MLSITYDGSYSLRLGNARLLLISLICVLLVSEIIFRGELNKAAGWVVALSLCVFLLIVDPEDVKIFLSKINSLNCIFAFLGLCVLIYYFMGGTIDDIVRGNWYYYNDIGNVSWNSKTLLNLLGNSDTTFQLFGFHIPRMTGNLIQASLIPAYYLLPLSIALSASSVSAKKVVIITVFSLFTLSGTVYFALFIAFIVYILRNKIPRWLFLYGPFIIFLFYVALSWSICADNAGNIRHYANLELTGINAVDNRLNSGVVRFAMITETLRYIFESLPFGVRKPDFGIFGGLILTNCYRSGILGAVLTAFFYFKLYGLIYFRLRIRGNSRLEKFGLCLMYSLLLQGMVYNDYGFSTYYGFAMLMVILVTINNRVTLCPLRTRA